MPAHPLVSAKRSICSEGLPAFTILSKLVDSNLGDHSLGILSLSVGVESDRANAYNGEV